MHVDFSIDTNYFYSSKDWNLLVTSLFFWHQQHTHYLQQQFWKQFKCCKTRQLSMIKRINERLNSFAFSPTAGEELCWDYNYQVDQVQGKEIYCQCGAESCRGRLL